MLTKLSSASHDSLENRYDVSDYLDYTLKGDWFWHNHFENGNKMLRKVNLRIRAYLP